MLVRPGSELVAWRELRNAIHHFRCDGITALADLGQRYPRRRQARLKQWRQEQGVPSAEVPARLVGATV